MTDKNALIIRRVIGILTAISVVAAGICLVLCSLTVYFEIGEYSRAAVKEVFTPVSAAVILCPVLVLIGLLFEFFAPASAKGIPLPNSDEARLKRLSEKKQSSPEIIKERRSRHSRGIALLAVCIGLAVLFLVYALNPDNYSTDINKSIIKAVGLLIPCFAVCFTFACVCGVLDTKSIKRELELLSNSEAKSAAAEAANDKPDHTKAIRFSILLIAIVLLVYGYVIGGTADVMTKAVNICTECIGLG